MNKDNARARINELIKMTSLVHGEHIARESSYLTKKWPDYRFLSPWKATLLFGKIYQKIFRRNIEMHVDRELAPNTHGVDLTKLERNQRERTSLFRARQRADSLGMKYDDYISLCFEFATNRKRTALPRPNQLHYSANSEQAWSEFVPTKWEERVNEWVVRPEDLPQYRVEHYHGLPAQKDYREFILRRSQHGSKPLKTHIRRHSLELNQVPVESFKGYHPEVEFMASIQSLENERKAGEIVAQPSLPITEDQLWQSCFGIQAARDFEQYPCRACSQAGACGKIAEYVSRKVKERCGSEDPLRAKEREGVNERVRKHRKIKEAKERITLLATPAS